MLHRRDAQSDASRRSLSLAPNALSKASCDDANARYCACDLSALQAVEITDDGAMALSKTLKDPQKGRHVDILFDAGFCYSQMVHVRVRIPARGCCEKRTMARRRGNDVQH